MKPVTIAVSVKNPGFAADLARGLSLLDRPYFIEFAGEKGVNVLENRWDVLLVDFDKNEGLTACFEPYRVIRADEDTCRISQISSQVDEAVRRYRDECTGSTDAFKERTIGTGTGSGKTRTVIFRSLWGGAGTTSLALAAGRMLSGAYGERVLYLPFTPRDGSLLYRRDAEAENTAEGNGMELFYRMRNGRPFHFSEYVSCDYTGLEYLSWGSSEAVPGLMSEEEQLQFLCLCAEQAEYDWILADFGTGDMVIPRAVQILVDNLLDCRTAYRRPDDDPKNMSEELQLTVQNRGLENRLEAASDPDGERRQKKFVMELMDDGESFVTDDAGKVEIVLSKSYAAGIKIFSEWLLETVGKSVEMWG